MFMSTLSQRFTSIRSKGEKALILFVTAGDPDIHQLPDILECLAEAGADVLEVGLPFSDPIADGPTIQASSQRALDRGITPPQVLDAVRKFHERATGIPVVLMGYYNPILRRGLSEFAREAAAAGVSGLIISDLTPEESDPWLAVAQSSALDTIFLAAPTSTDARLDVVAAKSSGFLYAVSRTGVTGAGNEVPPDVAALVGRIKAKTQTPVCVGFGVSRPEHVKMICQVADGVVVGSRLVDMLSSGFKADAVSTFIRSLKAETRA